MRRIGQLSIVFLMLISLSISVLADAPQIEVIDPNGGEILYIDTNYYIDVNLYDADAGNDLLLSIYNSQYSEGAGSYQYALIVDYNANNFCPNHAAGVEFSCIYDWDLSRHYYDVSDENLFYWGYMDNNRANNYVWDSSGNDNNLTNLSSDGNVADFNTEAGACIDGNCYTFIEYENDQIKLLNPDISFEQGSIMGWFNPDDWAAYTYNLIQWNNQNDITLGGVVLNLTESTVYFNIYDADGTTQCAINESVSGFVGWHHIAATWANGSNGRIYIDGNLSASTCSIRGANFAYSPAMDLYLGWNSSATYRHDYNGEIDRIAIYDKQIGSQTILNEVGMGRVFGGDYYIDANISDGTSEATDSSDAFFTVGGTEITIKQPKDEATHDLIYSWNLTIVGEAASQDFSGVLGDQNLLISNDINYSLYIDTNDSSYYGRSYLLTLPSPQETYILQPYLPKVVDSIETTIHSIRKEDLTAVAGIRVDINKVIESAEQVISSHITDLRGEALAYFLLGQTYEITVYDQNGGFLFAGDYTQTTYSDLYIYIDTEEFVLTSGFYQPIYVTFSPFQRIITDTEQTFTQTIRQDSADFNQVRVVVTNVQAGVDTNVLVIDSYQDINFGGGVTEITLDFNMGDFSPARDANEFTVTVYVFFPSGGVTVRSKTYYYTPSQPWFVLARLIPAEIGCDANDPVCPTAIFIAVFLSIILTVVVIGTFETFRTISGAVIIFLAFIGMFTYLGWVHIVLAAIMGIGGLFLLFTTWRHD
jgi:hypothetical protein